VAHPAGRASGLTRCTPTRATITPNAGVSCEAEASFPVLPGVASNPQLALAVTVGSWSVRSPGSTVSESCVSATSVALTPTSLSANSPAVSSVCGSSGGFVSGSKSNLKPRISAYQISIIAKNPFNAITFLESLNHRVADIGDIALRLFKEKREVTAIILTRSIMEVSALACCLYEKIESCIIENTSEGFNEFIINKLFGQKMGDAEFPVAINILKILKKLERKWPGFEEQYKVLYKYAHPNCYGVEGSYCKVLHENFACLFGLKNQNSISIIGVACFNASMSIFEFYYLEIQKNMPLFIDLRERDLNQKNQF